MCVCFFSFFIRLLLIQGVTGKFTPLEQILCVDAAELVPTSKDDVDPTDYAPRGDRYVHMPSPAMS